MRFRKFLEITAGYFEPEGTKPTGSGRQQEMPGVRMVLGQSDIQGVIRSKEVEGDTVTLSVEDPNGNSAEVNIPYDKFVSKDTEPPKEGDIIHVVFDQDGSLSDYKLVQAKPDVFVRTWGHKSPTSGSVGPTDQYGH